MRRARLEAKSVTYPRRNAAQATAETSWSSFGGYDALMAPWRASFHKGPVLTTRAYPVHWRSTGLILRTDAASASLEARKAFPWETFCQGLLLLILRKAKMPRVLRLAAVLVPFCTSTIKAREPAMRMCVLPRLKESRDTQARDRVERAQWQLHLR